MEASNRQPTAAARAWAAAAVAIAVNGLERGRRATALTRGILPQCRSAVESSSSREAGRRPGSSATSLAPICGIGRLRGHSLLMLRNAARETMRSGVDHIRIPAASVPFMPLCGRSVLPSMLHLCRSSPSLGRTARYQPTPFFPFHPFPRRHQSASPPSPPAVLGGCKVLLSLRRAARSPLFASFVSLWSGKRLRLQSVPTRRPRGRTGRHLTPSFMHVGSAKPALPLLYLNIPKCRSHLPRMRKCLFRHLVRCRRLPPPPACASERRRRRRRARGERRGEATAAAALRSLHSGKR